MSQTTDAHAAFRRALTAVVSMQPERTPMLISRTVVAVALTLTACTSSHDEAPAAAVSRPAAAGTAMVVRDTSLRDGLEVAGVAEPVQQATLSTKLMGTVTRVLVREGDVVRRGQLLLSIDARELSARATQVSASIESATAMQVEASAQAARIRALYADSAATRAQYDAVTAGMARADAGVRAARAAASELDAMRSYADVRAPFEGVVTARMADPGTFAAPGAPLLTVQDAATLRIAASVAADAVHGLRRGMPVDATIDGTPVRATIEGVVPAGAGNLFTVNATVVNTNRSYRAGSAATLRLGGVERRLLVVPAAAIVHEGDLTGVMVRGAGGDDLRWVRLGATHGALVEVTGGLRAGETIVVRTPATAGA